MEHTQRIGFHSAGSAEVRVAPFGLFHIYIYNILMTSKSSAATAKAMKIVDDTRLQFYVNCHHLDFPKRKKEKKRKKSIKMEN